MHKEKTSFWNFINYMEFRFAKHRKLICRKCGKCVKFKGVSEKGLYAFRRAVGFLLAYEWFCYFIDLAKTSFWWDGGIKTFLLYIIATLGYIAIVIIIDLLLWLFLKFEIAEDE